MPTPQLIISLAPSGDLQAELPGANGLRRVVVIDSISSIRRILAAQLVGPTQIGLDSAPTSGQVVHWEKHNTTKSEYCPWCVAETLGIDVSRRTFKRARKLELKKPATVTRFKPKSSKPLNLAALEEIL